ncbi:helix-turn-helix domain-containing protein [Bifidobacterium longum]|uniref:helix-turn-helix domain-containing protein n=1 Tax=Bifidobacterium longum TaxID=216816 RepID=UPI000B1E226C|nr:helix-turn-helix domain-containing protein [Bifidobacterium longum]
MSGLEERERAVELYFTTPMMTAQVVEHLGYPTRQCLERWLAMDSRYAGHMAKPIIPLETRRRAVELVLGGMQQKQAAKQLGAGVGAVHGWVRAYRKGGMAALQPKNRNSAQGNKCFASMFVRQVRQCFSVVWADGFPRCRHRFPVM